MTATAVRTGPALAVLATAQFLVVLTTSIVNVALPAIGRAFGSSPVGLSWVINAYVLVFGALLLLGGRLGDVIGRRSVFLLGTAIFTVGTVAASTAASAGILIAARALQGLGAALLAPTALGLVFVLFPPGPRRAKALSVWGAVSGVGGAAGVLLGGLLTDALGWRSVFLAAVPVAAVIMVAAWLLIPADAPAGGRIDWWGAATVTAGLLTLTYGLAGASTSGWTSPRTLGLLAGGAIVLGGFAVLQRRITAPLVPPRVLRTGWVAPANALMTMLGAAWLALFFFLPLYQQKVLHYTPVEAGLTQLPLAATMTLSSTLTPRILGRTGSRLPLMIAWALQTAGLLWLSRTPDHGHFLPDIAGPSLLLGAGLGAAFVILTALSASGVPATDAGLAGGMVNTTRQIGGAIGLAVLTAVSSTAGSPDPQAAASVLSDGYGAALAAAAGISAAAAVLTLLFRDR